MAAQQKQQISLLEIDLNIDPIVSDNIENRGRQQEEIQNHLLDLNLTPNGPLVEMSSLHHLLLDLNNVTSVEDEIEVIPPVEEETKVINEGETQIVSFVEEEIEVVDDAEVQILQESTFIIGMIFSPYSLTYSSFLYSYFLRYVESKRKLDLVMKR